MSRKYSTSTTLVIVESPAKCATIEKYLGPGYKCMASFGHLRELSSLKDIDLKNNFSPTYNLIENEFKSKQIVLLKKEIKTAGEVILATDDDREGEAIAWHICDLFHLDINKTKRMTFNEITESAIQYAVQNYRYLDMNKVQSQQARQILDLLVGFQITPVLWKYIKRNAENSLSAGRCQTPALKIIYENQLDINETREKQVYNTVGYFTNLNLVFSLNQKHEKEEDMLDFLSGTADFSHVYSCSKPKTTIKNPPEPLTTSRIQQEASNEFRFSPKETMKICQTLYEAGHITYMRTDSKTYSKEFVATVKEYIVRNFNDSKYIHPEVDSLSLKVKETKKSEENKIKETKKREKTKVKETDDKMKTDDKMNLAQEAHEAIRPTNIFLKELPSSFDSKERRMYKLIWENTLESCMSPASFLSVTANISAFNNLEFHYTSNLVDFPGWKIVSKKYENEIKNDHSEFQYLTTIKQGQIMKFKRITSTVTLTNTKSHYTEARLVQLLEEKGIGRPSTFSSLVDKIQERGYVKKEDVQGKEVTCKDLELEDDGEIYEIERKREFGGEKGKLIIQPLGIIVIEFLEKHFQNLFSYDYTQIMETQLDAISNGIKVWHELCRECQTEIDQHLVTLENSDEMKKINIALDDHNTYLIGKHGPVIRCTEGGVTTFKQVNKDIDMEKLKQGEYELDEIVDSTHKVKQNEFLLGQYEGHDVIIRKGKFGLYITWGENKKTLKELGNRPAESITFEEVEKYLQFGNGGVVREISSNISIRNSAKGNYIFYKTKKMKKPAFHSLSGFDKNCETCDIKYLKSWLLETYNIV